VTELEPLAGASLEGDKAIENTERTEAGYFKGLLLGLIVLAYFSGFVVRYDFLNRLGLSIASSTLPVYYLCVYSYDVLTREAWVVPMIVAMGSIVAAVCWRAQPATRRRDRKAIIVWCVYPGLMVAFVAAFPLLAWAAQRTADAQVLDLYRPRHELGTRLVLTRQFLDDHCGGLGARRFIDASPAEVRRRQLRANPLKDRCRDADVGGLLEASEDARLILVAESPQELIFFERPPLVPDALFPATRVYRVKKTDAALASTRIGP
jgi:nitrate reductase NapE component